VRNPIYVVLVAVILGQAVLFGDQRLLGYGVLVWLAFHIFVLAYEEPTLRQSYGAEYESPTTLCYRLAGWVLTLALSEASYFCDAPGQFDARCGRLSSPFFC